MSKKSKNQHSIPQAILDEFKDLSDGYKGFVEYIETKNGIDIYGYHFEEEVTIGFPEIYGYKDGQIIIFDHNGDYLGILSGI